MIYQSKVTLNMQGNKKVLICIILGFTISSLNLSYGQSNIEEVNYELIPYTTVRDYIHKQADRNIFSFSDLKPSWNSKQSADDYNAQKKIYLIKENLSTVWNKYRTTSPTESWNGKKVMFGFMFSRNNNSPAYCGDEISAIDTGQIIFLNLKLLKIYNLAMAFEVIALDPLKKTIEFSYMECNVSQGKQCLQFIDTPKGYTKIIHSSYFKSGSKFRDKLLYPFFHKRTTNEFHRIMKRIIKNS